MTTINSTRNIILSCLFIRLFLLYALYQDDAYIIPGHKNLIIGGRATVVIKLPPYAFASGWRRYVQVARLKASRSPSDDFLTPRHQRESVGVFCQMGWIMNSESISKTYIEDATGMVEVAFTIIADCLKNDNSVPSDAELKAIDDFLIKIMWVYKHTGQMYCRALQKHGGSTRAEQAHFI